MNIGKTLYLTDRKAFRKWLKQNHKTEKDIWLIFYRKDSGKSRLPYNDAVEEALCFGWIDSIIKKIDDEKFAQRFSPRKKNSVLSDLNKERVKRLIKQKKMTAAGLKAISHAFNDSHLNEKFSVPADILKELKADKLIWKIFQAFPESYKRIRIGWISSARSRPDIFKTRLNYFLKMTEKNKMYGMVK